MNTTLYTAYNEIIKFIKQHEYYITDESNFHNFYNSNYDNEFALLLKIKFDDKIKIYSEICNNARLAHLYSVLVIKERFPDGENVIKFDAYYRMLYERNFKIKL